MIKNYIVLICFLTANVMAMNNEWKVEGEFQLGGMREQSRREPQLKFIAPSDHPIKYIILEESKQKRDEPEISIFMNEDEEISKMLDGTGYYESKYYDKYYVCESKFLSNKFISIFSKKGLIPDDIVNQIIEPILHVENRLLEDVMSSLPVGYSISDLRKALVEEFNNIEFSIFNQTRAYYLVEVLKRKDIIDNELFINLYKLIVDKTLPFYVESRKELSFLTLKNSNDIEEKYKEPVIFGLESNMEDMLRNNLIKTFLYNDNVSNNPLPEDLTNLKPSSEDMFKCLNHIRKLMLENEELKQKISNLEQEKKK